MSKVRNPCTVAGCTARGIPGLIQGAGKCQHHYNVLIFGQDWADKVQADKAAKSVQC